MTYESSSTCLVSTNTHSNSVEFVALAAASDAARQRSFNSSLNVLLQSLHLNSKPAIPSFMYYCQQEQIKGSLNYLCLSSCATIRAISVLSTLSLSMNLTEITVT